MHLRNGKIILVASESRKRKRVVTAAAEAEIPRPRKFVYPTFSLIDYETLQTDLKPEYRATLFDWIVRVARQYKLQPSTILLTYRLIDLYLQYRPVSRTKLQAVGCGALLIAVKYAEIFFPTVDDLVYLGDNSYTSQELLKIECNFFIILIQEQPKALPEMNSFLHLPFRPRNLMLFYLLLIQTHHPELLHGKGKLNTVLLACKLLARRRVRKSLSLCNDQFHHELSGIIDFITV